MSTIEMLNLLIKGEMQINGKKGQKGIYKKRDNKKRNYKKKGQKTQSQTTTPVLIPSPWL